MAFNVRSGGEHVVLRCINESVVSGDIVFTPPRLVGIADTDRYLGGDGNYYVTVAIEGVAHLTGPELDDTFLFPVVGNDCHVNAKVLGSQVNDAVANLGIVTQSDAATETVTVKFGRNF